MRRPTCCAAPRSRRPLERLLAPPRDRPTAPALPQRLWVCGGKLAMGAP